MWGVMGGGSERAGDESTLHVLNLRWHLQATLGRDAIAPCCFVLHPIGCPAHPRPYIVAQHSLPRSRTPPPQAGAPAVVGLLGMLSSALGAMDAAATAAHHEAVFATLLRALDLRRRRPASLAAGAAVDEVEAAAVSAFEALTLKLSEAQFKPLFLRLLDWAGSALAAGAGLTEAAARAARGLALAAVANALAERLRSVFVPYFRYLLDPFLEQLTGGWVGGWLGGQALGGGGWALE